MCGLRLACCTVVCVSGSAVVNTRAETNTANTRVLVKDFGT